MRSTLYTLRALLVLFIVSLAAGCNFPAGQTPAGQPASNPAVPAPGSAAPDPLQPTQLPHPTPAAPEEAARQLMLFSHTHWKAVYGEAVANSYPPGGTDGQPQVQRVQAWVRLPGEARWVAGPAQGSPDLLWVSDGKRIRDFTGETYDLPPAVLEGFNPPLNFSDTIQPHPMAGTMGGPLMDMLFPAGLAQRGGEYRLAGRESLASRQALVLEWSYTPGELTDRFWVDAETGIILRWQNYGKQRQDAPLSDIYFNIIQYDPQFAPETFDLNQTLENLNSGGQLQAQGPVLATILKNESGYVNLRSGPGTTYPVLAELTLGQSLPVTGKSAGGDWLQVDYNGQPAWVWITLVELQGDAAALPVIPAP